MKKSLFLLLAIAFFTTGCKKDDDSTPDPGISEWAFDGKNYKFKGAFWQPSSGGSYLFVSDGTALGGGNFVNITFGANLTKPPGGTLTVIAGGAASNPSTCRISVGNTDGDSFVSTGKAGDQVTLTVSPERKLTASFSNITVAKIGSSSTKTVSGTIREE